MNIVVNAEEEEVDVIVTNIDRTCTRYKMEIDLDKAQIRQTTPRNLKD